VIVEAGRYFGLLALNEITDGLWDFRASEPFFEFGVLGLTIPSQHMSDAGNEGKPALAQEADGGEDHEDTGSHGSDNARMIEDLDVFLEGRVGSLGS
jgi:hypothetical protein